MMEGHRSGCNKLNGSLKAADHLLITQTTAVMTCGALGFSLVTLRSVCVA
jgi:hypothetical protein